MVKVLSEEESHLSLKVFSRSVSVRIPGGDFEIG